MQVPAGVLHWSRHQVKFHDDLVPEVANLRKLGERQAQVVTVDLEEITRRARKNLPEVSKRQLVILVKLLPGLIAHAEFELETLVALAELADRRLLAHVLVPRL